MKIHAITLIRNEIDIIDACITQSRQLFDSHIFVDMLSTDGTLEELERASHETSTISVLYFKINAKYQSEISNELARLHFGAGADWVFFIDADEFLRVGHRADLEEYLLSFGGDVMHLPWLNLVPSKFDRYDHFSFDQEFFWSGRASGYRKIALRYSLAGRCPDFWVTMGNHAVLLSAGGAEAAATIGVPILHVPVRSRDRLAYKAQRESIILRNKVNRQNLDGQHLRDIEALLTSQSLSDNELRLMALNYGDELGDAACAEIVFPSLPRIELPDYLRNGSKRREGVREISVSEVLLRDKVAPWKKPRMIEGSKVRAEKIGDQIHLRCQPVRGDGSLIRERYAKLSLRAGESIADSDYFSVVNSLTSAAFISPRVYEFSAWSGLIPVLSTIITMSAPRRYVELGVHNGMSFFAACNSAQKLGLDLECVAIDSWLGDEHAGFHSPEVFERFKHNLARIFPSQHFIQGFFQEAADCFESGSIDLLHIDGLHTYEAVKLDFETWLPKMSESGVVIIHDTNVYQGDFGVWRYWSEISSRYPSFNFKHSHGLGILYVGSIESPVKDVLELISNNQGLAECLQTAFVGLGELMTEGQRLKFELERKTSRSNDSKHLIAPVSIPMNVSAEIALERILSDKWWRRTRPFRSASNRIRKLRGKPQKRWPDLSPR